MNFLSFPRQVEVVSLLTEGNSLRAVARLTNVDRNTVVRINNRVGAACQRLHQARMRDLQIARLEVDESWSFVGVKQKNLKPDSSAEQGDCYLWLALDADRKAIISYHVGKRSAVDARTFTADLRGRLVNRPQITTDGYAPYVEAIEEAFGTAVDYAMLKKQTTGVDGPCFGLTKEVQCGQPDLDKVSTSFVERVNLTTRMHLRRCARRTNAFSKKLVSHQAAIALHIAFYNWVRVHETLRVTPAMELGLTDHVWSVAELLREALDTPTDMPPLTTPQATYPRPGRHPFKLRVIRGGKIG